MGFLGDLGGQTRCGILLEARKGKDEAGEEHHEVNRAVQVMVITGAPPLSCSGSLRGVYDTVLQPLLDNYAAWTNA